MVNQVIIPKPCGRDECDNMIPKTTKSGNLKSYWQYERSVYCGQTCSNMLAAKKNIVKPRKKCNPHKLKTLMYIPDNSARDNFLYTI